MVKRKINPLATNNAYAKHWDMLEDARVACADVLRQLDYTRFASARQDVSRAGMLIESAQATLLKQAREAWHAQ